MAFNVSEWIMRRRIGAQVRNGGRSVEHSRIANPYHAVSIEVGSKSCAASAVSIETGTKACAASRKLEGRRYLSASAPMLPVKGCTQATCQCRYVHYNDRRSPRDRRVNFANPHAHKMNDRREGSGRRMTD